MKVHQFTHGLWEHEPFLTLGCKRLRPLAPKFYGTTDTITTTTTKSFDLKSFIKPENGSKKYGSIDDNISNNNCKRDSPSSPHSQVETHSGGTRWNPTQEQIGILEMLYKGGMRTPNAEQIEKITIQLGKYGKIEGKNVFYWFQNHKARERQKQKRNSLGLSHTSRTPSITTTTTSTIMASPTTFATTINFETLTSKGEVVERDNEDSPYKKCRNWAFEYMEDQNWSSSSKDNDEDHHQHKTLELFPLHPESR